MLKSARSTCIQIPSCDRARLQPAAWSALSEAVAVRPRLLASSDWTSMAAARQWAVLSSLLLAAYVHMASSTTILALPMFGGNSPSLDIMAIAGELQMRGYDILTAIPDTDIKFMQNAVTRHRLDHPGTSPSPEGTGTLSYVTVQSQGGSFKEVLSSAFASSNNTGLPIRKLLPQLIRAIARPCEWLLANETAMQIIKDAQPALILSFDLPLGHDSCACVMSHLLGVPYVVADGHPMMSGPLSTPQFGTSMTLADLRTPIGQVKNMAAYIMSKGMFTLLPMLTSPWRGIRKAGGLAPRRHYGGCNPAVHMHLKTFDLEYPRPLPPGTVMLGPGSPRSPHPPAQQKAAHPETWEFLEAADHEAGMVLVGFGSTGIFGLSMQAEDYKNLAQAFSDLAPTRVLWPLLPSNLPQGLPLADLPLGLNVLVVPWVDYNDVLGHPATRLFISHCGIHSMWEAAFHGVPVIGVPFQKEQRDNALKLASRGLGEVNKEAVAYRSAKNRLTFQRETMRELARKVLTTPSYHAAAAKLSAKLQAHAAFRHPLERAADEMEVLIADTRHTPRTSSSSSSSGRIQAA